MFFRHKRSGRTEYLQIVKNERVDGKPRQSVVATLDRVDELAQKAGRAIRSAGGERPGAFGRKGSPNRRLGCTRGGSLFGAVHPKSRVTLPRCFPIGPFALAVSAPGRSALCLPAARRHR
jgi:hypothetical protein